MDFGFEQGGSIEISIKHPVHLFTVEGADPVDKTRYGFFITASKADTALENDIAKGGCLLDDLDHTLVLFTFEDMQSHLSKDGDEYKFSFFTFAAAAVVWAWVLFNAARRSPAASRGST